MDHLFSLLKLTLWALHISGLWPTVVEVAGSCEGTTQLRNLTRSLVDGDDVTAHNLFFLDGLDHLGTKVVNGFHLGGFKGDLTSLGTRLNGLVNFDFNNLSLNNFSFFSDSDSYFKNSNLIRVLEHS